MLVSYPQYIRLMKLQEKALKLDTIMRKLAEGQDPNKLAENAKWNELLALRQSLQKLLPADHPEFDLTVSNPAKRGATMDFNGIQVTSSFHLNVQKQVQLYTRINTLKTLAMSCCITQRDVFKIS